MKKLQLLSMITLCTIFGMQVMQASSGYTITNNAVKPGNAVTVTFFTNYATQINAPVQLAYQGQATTIPTDAANCSATVQKTDPTRGTITVVPIFNNVPLQPFTHYSITHATPDSAWEIIPVQ